VRPFPTILVCLLCASTFSCGNSYLKQYPQVWGVWNEGPEENARFRKDTSMGGYAGTFWYLSFDPGNRKWRPHVSTDGYIFYILDIKGTFPDFEISAEWGYNWPPQYIKGVFKMHFEGTDKMWLESVDASRNDDKFPAGFFRGRQTIYWRANKTNLSTEELGGGDLPQRRE
jgi:hypothetical protein